MSSASSSFQVEGARFFREGAVTLGTPAIVLQAILKPGANPLAGEGAIYVIEGMCFTTTGTTTEVIVATQTGSLQMIAWDPRNQPQINCQIAGLAGDGIGIAAIGAAGRITVWGRIVDGRSQPFVNTLPGSNPPTA